MAMRTKSKAQDPGSRRACDAPNISGRQFLLEVMHDPSIALKQRIKAASALLRLYPDESFTPRLTIRIPDQPSLSTTPAPRASDGRLGERSHFSPTSHITTPHSGDPTAPVNLTRYTDPPTLTDDTEPYTPDYSIPPTPAEIEEIKAAVHALRPDFDPSQPVELFQCSCGHWLTHPCNCIHRTTKH
jgi:hypothetical protein